METLDSFAGDFALLGITAILIAFYAILGLVILAALYYVAQAVVWTKNHFVRFHEDGVRRLHALSVSEFQNSKGF